MASFRFLVTSADDGLRRSAASALAEMGYDVLTADGGVDCLDKLRAAPFDLLVLIPPLLWGSVAGVLAVAHEDPETRRVPVLILPPRDGDAFPRIPRLFVGDAPDRAPALAPLVESVCECAKKWCAGRGHAPANGAPRPAAPGA